ncbi:MAG: T9SS type A sorting domain-containing protein [FCB group bacterium]
MLNKLLVLVLSFLISYTAYAQNAWNNLTLPPMLNTAITSYANSGGDFYLGTNGQGVFYTNDSGQTWSNNSPAVMFTGPITKLLINPTGGVFAFGGNGIYSTTDKGMSWVPLTPIPQSDGTLQCEAISPKGTLAIGTNLGIFIYTTTPNGSGWRAIYDMIGSIDVRTIFFNQNEQIFLSGIFQQNPTIYLTDVNGRSYTKIVNNITEPPLVTDFTMDTSGIVFAAVGSSIYQFDNAANLWTLLTNTGQSAISKIRTSGTNYIIVVCDVLIKIFDRKAKIWEPDSPSLNFNGSIIDISIDGNNNVHVITNNAISISQGGVDGIIRLILSNYFIVKDDLGNPMKNKTFALYKASCDNNQVFLQNITTNKNGGFYLNYNYYSLQALDQIKLEKLVYTKYAVKTGHEEFGNKMYDVYLNNMQYDGAGNPSYYPLNNNNQQTIYMSHTMIHRFLVVSVEWEAKKEYLDTLASWCKLMSNFLYDVTDGQLYVEGISINDNFEKWYQADIRIFASNLVWPNSAVGGINHPDADQAQVRLPRRWYGNSDDTRNYDEKDWWLNWGDWYDDLFMSSTIAHELGHYMFGFYDEYVWTDPNKAKSLPNGYNMGFMQYQYQNAPDWSSEMSDPDRYYNPDFKYTAQFAYNGSDCWTQFKNSYQGYYNDTYGDQIWIPIKMPTDRTLDVGYSFLRGPMDYKTGQNQCSMIPLVQVNIHDVNLGSGDYLFTATDQYSNPLPKADVYDYAPLFKTYIKKDYQGETADNGTMIVVGANVNDEIIVATQVPVNLGLLGTFYEYYFQTFIVNSVSGAKENINITQANNVLQLSPVKDNTKLVNTMKYDLQGNVTLNIFTDKNFNSMPTIDFPLSNDSLKNYTLVFDNQKSLYNLKITDPVAEQGTLLLKTTDSASKPFSILFNYQISNFGKNIFAPGGTAELILDSNNSQIEKISALSSNFTPIRTGVGDNTKQAGSVVSFSTAPGSILPSTQNLLNLRYSRNNLTIKEEASLSIFKWDENKLTWNKLNSIIDTSTQVITTPLNSDGTYAAFTTISPTGLLDNNTDYFSLDAYPNPIINTAKIEFYLPQSGFTTLSLYNALGQELITFVNSNLESGKQDYNLDGSGLSAGVYYLRLKVDNSIAIKKVEIIK